MTQTSAEMLSAYVDGELPPEDRARIEIRSATDPALARRIEVLGQMKAAVAGIGADTAPMMPVFAAPPRRIRSMLSAAALLCVLAFFVGWIGAATLGRNGPATLPDMVARAVALHDDWSTKPAQWTVKPAVMISGFEAPELIEAGLALVAVNPDAQINGQPAIQASYLGQHGCRVSLFRIRQADGDDVFHITNNGDVQSATWADSAFRYVVIARHLDVTRFTVLADALNTMTSNMGRKPTRDIVAQLESAHQPCTG